MFVISRCIRHNNIYVHAYVCIYGFMYPQSVLTRTKSQCSIYDPLVKKHLEPAEVTSLLGGLNWSIWVNSHHILTAVNQWHYLYLLFQGHELLKLELTITNSSSSLMTVHCSVLSRANLLPNKGILPVLQKRASQGLSCTWLSAQLQDPYFVKNKKCSSLMKVK